MDKKDSSTFIQVGGTGLGLILLLVLPTIALQFCPGQLLRPAVSVSAQYKGKYRPHSIANNNNTRPLLSC